MSTMSTRRYQRDVVCMLRSKGATYEDIAKEMGFHDRRTAWRICNEKRKGAR